MKFWKSQRKVNKKWKRKRLEINLEASQKISKIKRKEVHKTKKAMSGLVSLLSSYVSDSDSDHGSDDQHHEKATTIDIGEPTVKYEFKELKSDLALAVNPTPLVELSVCDLFGTWNFNCLNFKRKNMIFLEKSKDWCYIARIHRRQMQGNHIQSTLRQLVCAKSN